MFTGTTTVPPAVAARSVGMLRLGSTPVVTRLSPVGVDGMRDTSWPDANRLINVASPVVMVGLPSTPPMMIGSSIG